MTVQSMGRVTTRTRRFASPLRRTALSLMPLGMLLGAALGAAGCSEACDGRPSPHEASTGSGLEQLQAGDERPAELVIGLTPYLDPATMLSEYAPLAEYLTEKLGLPTRIAVATNYDDLANRLHAFETHIAAFSPFSYVRAKRDYPGIILFATHIASGSSTFSAYLISQAKAGFATVEDLRGKRFGFVDRGSASGYLYPLAYLRSLGLEPETFFSSVTFAGNHPALIQQVLDGKIDAGATFSTAYRIADSKNLRILAKTGRIPYDAYCANPRLSTELLRKVSRHLLSLSTRDEVGRRVLGSLTNINGFVAVGDDHYDEVRRVARLVESTNAPLTRDVAR